MYFIFRIRGICKIHEKTCYDRELLRNNLLVIQQAIEDGVQTTAEQFQKLSNLEKLDMLDYIAEASL